jgi:hypothetical protein
MVYPTFAQCFGGLDAFARLACDMQLVTDVASLQQFSYTPPTSLAFPLVRIGVQNDMPAVVFYSQVCHIVIYNETAKIRIFSV